MSTRVLAFIGFVLAIAAPTAQGADPRLSTLLPRGAQRGTEVTVTLYGDRLADAEDLVFYSPGITLLELTPRDDRSAQARLRIEPDCAIGLHAVRVRTATGISNLRTFSVGVLPEINEVEPNNAANAPQIVELDRTINGRVTTEDVDYYSFEASEGERVAVEIEGLRLGDMLFDPAIALIDEAGFELASCDDHALLRQDAAVVATIPEDGTYTVVVRESAYRGENRAWYRLHLGRFPRPVGAVPAGGPAETSLELRWIGAAADTTTVPASGAESFLGWAQRGVVGLQPSESLGAAPTPNRVRASALTNHTEVEPNNTDADATPMTAPGAANGVIEQPGDLDRFVFSATKGQVFDVRVHARSLGSPLDSVLGVRARDGQAIGSNDDSVGPDSALRVEIPEDGEYVVVVRDHLRKGGAAHFYRVEIQPPQPLVRLSGPRPQQAVAVPRGGRAMILLEAERVDVGGTVALLAEGLPAGVTMHVPPIPSGLPRVPAVFEAAPDASKAHGLGDIQVTVDGEPSEGGFRQDVEQVLGRNRVVFWAHSVSRLPVAVTDPSPFSIDLVTPSAPLVQSGSAELVVRAVRAEGYSGAIKLSVPFLPPGVSANQSVSLAPDQTEATIALNASARARVGEWSLVVEARAGTDAGELRVSSGLEPLTIASPFVAFKPQATSVEKGQATSMFIGVDRLPGFTGTAQVELAALPHNVTADPMPLTEAGDGLTFQITTATDSPAGRHKGVFCVARFTTEAGEVVHRLPAGELIIQNPPPAKTTAAAPPPPPPPEPKADAPKPLTRLQKLRQQHEARKQQEETEGSEGEG